MIIMLNFVVLSLIELYKYGFCQRKALYTKKMERQMIQKNTMAVYFCAVTEKNMKPSL